MKLYQLSTEEYAGQYPGWWLVVSDDLEEEIAGPFETKEEAEAWITNPSW